MTCMLASNPENLRVLSIQYYFHWRILKAILFMSWVRLMNSYAHFLCTSYNKLPSGAVVLCHPIFTCSHFGEESVIGLDHTDRYVLELREELFVCHEENSIVRIHKPGLLLQLLTPI